MPTLLTLSEFKRHWKTHAFMAGMTLAFAAPILQQGCPLSGQCPTCGACAVRVPLLALPLLLDTAVVLGDKVRRKVKDSAEPEPLSGDPPSPEG